MSRVRSGETEDDEMDKTDLERMQNGLASGSGSDQVTVEQNGEKYTYNIVGAANAMLNVLDTMEEYDRTMSDLSQEEIDQLARGQEAFQQLAEQLANHLSTLAGDDGSVALPNGSTIDLPSSASSTATGDLPQTQ